VYEDMRSGGGDVAEHHNTALVIQGGGEEEEGVSVWVWVYEEWGGTWLSTTIQPWSWPAAVIACMSKSWPALVGV